MHETTNRCNGHIQVSPTGKASKRDRKGCKKGKIDAIMKNNMGSTKPKLHIESLFNKKKNKLLKSINRFGSSASSGGVGGGGEIIGITPGSVIKSEIIDDPYTFTDCESNQNVSLYLTANNLINSGSSCLMRKEQSGRVQTNSAGQQNNLLHSSSVITNNSIISNKSNNSDSQILPSCSDNNTNNNSTSNINSVNKAVTSLSTSYKYSINNRNNLNTINNYSNKISNSNSNCGSSGVSTNVSRGSSTSNISTTSSSNISSSNSNNNNNNSVIGNLISSNHNCVDGNSSKTMNRLQADIARNKVIVKKRKILCQQSPTSISSSLFMNSSSHNKGDGNNSSNSILLNSSIKCEPGVHPLRMFAKVTMPAKRQHRQTTWQRERRIRHEALQRIQDAQLEAADVKRDLFPFGLDVSESDDDNYSAMDSDSDEVYQRHWFMGCGSSSINGQTLGISIRGRESRLTQFRSELRRRLRQVWRGIERRGEPPPDLVSAVVTAARTQPAATAMLINPQQFEIFNNNKTNRAKVSMLDVKQCSLCQRKALPCTRHCARHIMYNVDQLLFEYCTGKLDDKTQCRVPVFDIAHQMPLCPQHAKKRDTSIKVFPDSSLKKSRKKSKTSTLARSTKRGKKKKKKPLSVLNSSNSNAVNSSSNGLDVVHSTTDDLVNNPVATVQVSNVIDSVVDTQHDILSSGVTSSSSSASHVEIQVQLEDVVEEVPEEVLAIASLDPAELASQASRLLEDQDLSNMLNIPADAFNDLFTEDKNGEYEPTREETEELERALEAVDNDVRSLERMTRSMPALPLTLPLPLETMTTLLDDPAVTSALPGVYAGVGYPNGFTSSVQTDLRHS